MAPVTTRDQDEQNARIDQIMADIANKSMDTAYKQGLLKYEPWKLVFTAFAAGAALVGAIVGLESYLHRSDAQSLQLPPGTVITVPGGRL